MALAITSFPVPVSPWINTAESTGDTLTTSANNAWNFGLDPIKFRLVISLVLLECGRSTISIKQHALASTLLSRDPLAEVWIAIRQRNASRFALSKKSHAILTGQSQLLEVKNDAAIFPFGGDERFQFDDVLFVDPAA
jgi:hypothetical protein